MRRILVTGGCGFIGSNFIRHLLATDQHIAITNLDSLSYAGNPENLADLTGDSRYRFLKGDIADPSIVRKAMAEGIEAILNFAAESHVDRSILDSAPFLRTNVLGTHVLLEAAREFRIQKYIQISTDEVYGSRGDAGYFSEDSPLQPSSPYSACKAAGDLLVRSYVHTYGVPAVITRCSNNYGPYQFPEKLLPLFITNLLRDEPVPVYGDGQNIRDWIHVRDHCEAIEQVWRFGHTGQVYNISGRCELTNLQLTHRLLEAMEKPLSLIRYVKDRPGHDRRYAIDCRKIEGELGWAPKVSFAEGLRETVNWYKANEPWVDRIRSGEYLKYYEKQYGDR